MNVKMRADDLKRNGFDGLFWQVGGDSCACKLDDLCPCGEDDLDCQPGYLVPGCPPECGLGCEFHIVREKP